MQPRWKTEPNDVDVIKGKSVMIDCEAEGFPPPRITWRKAEGIISIFFIFIINMN